MIDNEYKLTFDTIYSYFNLNEEILLEKDNSDNLQNESDKSDDTNEIELFTLDL